MKKSSDSSGVCCAVFDAGKTNKKLVIFDAGLNMVESSCRTFDEIQENGINYERADETVQWLLDTLAEMASRHDIGAISVSTHGAGFACVDADGALAVPMLAYTTDPGLEFHDEFYRGFGKADDLHVSTATPNMPGLGCMAKGIYFAGKAFPGGFDRTETILGLPQYYGFLLTGRKCIEYTYIGTHTYLWDFKAMKYSSIVDRMGIRRLLPEEMLYPWDMLGTVSGDIARKTGLKESTIVTAGIHDSNAALLPYLIKMKKPFVLNSTGTVCVAMRPAEKAYISPEEAGKVVYYNMNAFTRPVRTAIFLGGFEFDVYTGQLAPIHGGKPFPPFNRALCEDIMKKKSEFIIPSVVPFGIFPGSQARIIENGRTYALNDIFTGTVPDFFRDYERACMIINISLALQSGAAMKLTGMTPGDDIFIDGGFHKNDMYTSLLAGMLPGHSISVSAMEEATAFGGALLCKAALEGKNPMELGDSFQFDHRHLNQPAIEGFAKYLAAFMGYIAGQNED